jgi:serine/threonine protein kinase
VSPSGVGQQLGDYRLEEIIGQGGMGVVYRATQLGLERTVAVKVIAPGLAADDTFRERFQREARMLAHVDHPHVIPIHHAGEADGQLFLSMRWVDGHDLAQEIRASPRGMEAERALLFLRQIGGRWTPCTPMG